jgi:hypothetical protein
MNTDVLKKPTLWLAVVVALTGIAMAHGLVVEGSKIAEVIGWAMAFIGTFLGGKTTATLPEAPTA